MRTPKSEKIFWKGQGKVREFWKVEMLATLILPTGLGKDLKNWQMSTTHHNVGQWLGIYKALLQRFKRKNFFQKIVIGDEIQDFSDNPVYTRSWVDPGQPTRPAKRNINGRNLLLCILGEIHGILYFKFLKFGKTITAQQNSSQMMKLNTEKVQKCPWTGKGCRSAITSDLLYYNVAANAKTT